MHTRHVHAFLRRYNTTTTWFGSDTAADSCRSAAVSGGGIGNEGHRRSVLGDGTSSERRIVGSYFLSLVLSSPSMVRTSLFHHSDYRTNYHIPPPRKKECLGSRVAKRAFFPLFQPILHQRRVGSIGAAPGGGALPARDVNMGRVGLLCLLSVYLGVLYVIWSSEEDECELWTLGRESKGRRIGLELFPPRPTPSFPNARSPVSFQKPTCLPARRSIPCLSLHRSKVLVRKL